MDNIAGVKDKIRQYIIDTTFAPAEQVANDTLIFVDGIFDSMGFISLINFIEETYAIKAQDSELLEDNFESIDAIAGFIERKLK